MTEFGYTLMCEQSEPKQLVADADSQAANVKWATHQLLTALISS